MALAGDGGVEVGGALAGTGGWGMVAGCFDEGVGAVHDIPEMGGGNARAMNIAHVRIPAERRDHVHRD
jgi:hypothetical protein